MVSYECEECKFTTILKGNYKQHLKTKKHIKKCNNSLSSMVKTTKDHKKTTKDHKKTTNDHKKYKCDYCINFFSTFAHKRRHELHYCKENYFLMKEKIKKIEKEKNKKIKKLEKKIEKLIDKVGVVNNTNNTNNTKNIIVLNNYDKENTDYLTSEKIEKLLNRPYDSIQELIKMLHFDTSHPENHNVKITNKKEPYALVWNDSIWELRKKKTVVKDLVDKGYMLLDTTYEDIEQPNKKYLKFQDNYENQCSSIKNKIEKESEIVIINESKKIENII